MTSPPNTTGWNSARSNFTNFAQVNSSQPTLTISTKEETTNATTTGNFNTTRGSGDMPVILERSPRDEYYSTHYSYQTGLRIALTLGSFFLFVLLTLLYKSKCKKHSSRCPSPLLPGPLLSPPPALSTTGSGGPPDFLHHQVHPYNNSNTNFNSHPNSYDYFPSSNYNDSFAVPITTPLPHPALLLTSANSDSSDEEISIKPCSTSTAAAVNRYLQSSSGGGRQSIDIHVILPTPTISPSSSEHFRADQHQPHPGPSSEYPLPPLIHHLPQQHYYYLNDRRRSSASSSNTTWTGGTSPFTGSPFTFPDNLKYVDDTSSENIPGGRDEELEGEEDQGSVGSDSVFACCEPPPPPLPPKNSSRRPSACPSCYNGLTAEEEWKISLSQARAQVHHRDSFASDLESVNDYLEGISGGGSGTASRRRSSSTQTTLSDLQHCLGIATSGMRSPSPRLSPQSHPLPHHFMSLRQSPVQFLAAPPSGGGSISPRIKGGRKRSVDALLLGRREQQQQLQHIQMQRFSGSTSPSLDQDQHRRNQRQCQKEDHFEVAVKSDK